MKKGIILLLFLAGIFSAVLSHAQDSNTRQRQFNTGKGHLALSGYDAVSYFSGKPQKGAAANSVTYQGIVYYFASAKNKAAFSGSPEKYLPQYGGWCAYAMGKDGAKVAVDPETFKISGGRLYLFYNKYFNNTRKSWDKDESTLRPAADRNWQKFAGK